MISTTSVVFIIGVLVFCSPIDFWKCFHLLYDLPWEVWFLDGFTVQEILFLQYKKCCLSAWPRQSMLGCLLPVPLDLYQVCKFWDTTQYTDYHFLHSKLGSTSWNRRQWWCFLCTSLIQRTNILLSYKSAKITCYLLHEYILSLRCNYMGWARSENNEQWSLRIRILPGGSQFHLWYLGQSVTQINWMHFMRITTSIFCSNSVPSIWL